MSHPTRGAWIEIRRNHCLSGHIQGSHPTRGAWIEMYLSGSGGSGGASHPTRGAWIEMDFDVVNPDIADGRTPPGVRGLKYHLL